MIQKTTFVEINKRNQRPIVLFGRGKVAEKSLRKLGHEKVAFVVDNSKAAQEGDFMGLDVKSPEVLTNDYLVLICSTDLTNIGKQLERLNLTANQDFVGSPILNDLLAISELEQLQCRFYFTSGTVADTSGPWGGGLYECEVDGTNITINRLYSGPCYGAIHHDGQILFVNGDKGLFAYRDNEVRELITLPKGARAHGLSFNTDNNHFYISCSNRDQVLEFDADFNEKRTFRLSNKYELQGEAVHHMNDNVAAGNSLYVSMFSSTGNWKKDVFDGCIAEFDLASGERLDDPVRDLYMPHNVRFFDGGLHVLDSLPGHLRFNNMKIQGTFSAFTRGLDYKHGLYFIGQSKNRNYSKVMGLSNNVSIDCGVIVFNPELKVSRFIPLPYETGEIHSIVIDA